MRKLILIAIVVTIVMVACKKTTDTTNPVIVVTSPTEGQMFANGDSALVAFTITDEDFHGFDFRIINTVTGDTLFAEDEHTHANVTFSKKYKLPAVATQMRLILTGEDHNGNTATKPVNFHTM